MKDSLDSYYCVFFKEHDPRTNKPAAFFDRYQFLAEFLRMYGDKFRESDEESIVLTVADWRKLYQKGTENDQA